MPLSKAELHSLIASVKNNDAESIQKAATFVANESLGIWHNRARAKLCRHFKNNPPNLELQSMMTNAIAQRLKSGKFFEQFKDQLAMAIRLAPAQMHDAAAAAIQSKRAYIRRYGLWVLDRIERNENLDDGDNFRAAES